MSKTANAKRIRSLKIAIEYLRGCKNQLRKDPKAKTQDGALRMAAYIEIDALNDAIYVLDDLVKRLSK